MFTYETLLQIIGNLRFSDAAVLNRSGFDALKRNFDAYPITFNDVKLCVLIPSGMRPIEIKRLSEEEAALKVIVLKDDTGKWLKVWPPLRNT